jgi:mannan endo-1,4-beta-mannosidase
MTTRAQVIRAHNYLIAGRHVPPHAIPPHPTITSLVSRIYWQGSAGAKNYSIERAPSAAGPWKTICGRCVTDASNGYVDRRPAARNSWYRVIPYNLDGKPGRASTPKKSSP